MTALTDEDHKARIQQLGTCVHCGIRPRGFYGDRLCGACRRNGIRLTDRKISRRHENRRDPRLLKPWAPPPSDRLEDLRRLAGHAVRELAVS